jgi:zinc protease
VFPCIAEGSVTMRHIAGFITLAAMSVPAFADDVTTFTLPNGLQGVVIEDHRAPVVVNMVWYRVGSADEKRGTSGVAHFLEHLMFKGTDTMAPGELSKVVEANGGSDNAFTSYDYTAYFQRVAADRLDLMMTMEADRMRNLILSEDDWKTEREVIIEERNQRTDSDPGAIFGEQTRAAQFLNHPYGTPTIGWKHEMSNLTRQDALDWYKTFYAPNNAVLVVAGDVMPADVQRLAEIHFGALQPSDGIKERIRPSEPPQLAERRLSYADPRVSQPYVMRTYLAPERDSGAQESAAALTMLAAILGGNGQTSVMGRKLTFDTHTALYTSAFYDGTSYDDTTFGLVIVPAEGVTLQAAEDAMDKVIADFMTTGIDDAQFSRIKAQITAGIIYAKDSTEGLAQQYGEALTTGLTVQDVEAWPDVLQAVTEDDVMNAAREVFDRKQSVTGWMKKDDAAEVVQ